MSDPHLLELQGRLKRVLLESRIEEGYDRQASHSAGRYVAHQVGLSANPAYLDAPELAEAFAETAIEELINALTLDDLERLVEMCVRRGEPVLQPGELNRGDTVPVMEDVLEPQTVSDHEISELMEATPSDGELDRFALTLARSHAVDNGLPPPADTSAIKLGHWRRKALQYAWENRARAGAA